MSRAPLTYPNCPECGGLGHQNGCDACHNSGVDQKAMIADWKRRAIESLDSPDAPGKKAKVSRAGRKAYGARPGEAEGLNLMRELRLTMGYGRIASALNEAGFRPRKGRKFYAAVIRRILLRVDNNSLDSGSERV